MSSNRTYRALPRGALVLAGAVALAASSTTWAAPTKGAPAEQKINELLREILAAPELEDAAVGVHIRDVQTGKTLFQRNGTRLMNPASNVKLVTTAAALAKLGPSYRFSTIAYRDPDLRGGTLNGNLYVKGRGDPTLTNETLFGLVNEIALKGIDRIQGDVIVDDSFFDNIYEGPGWEQERSDQSYAAPMGALSVNFGTFSVRVVPGDGGYGAAKVMVWPNIPMFEVSSDVVTRGSGTPRRLFVGTTQEGDKVKVTVRGFIASDDHLGANIYKRVYEPTVYAGQVIYALLEMRGVKIKGKVKVGRVGRGALPIAYLASEPLAEIISTLNKYSNNFIAEQILKTLGAELGDGPGSWASGCRVIGGFLEEIGITKGSYVMGNGSGLNDINRFTPEQITMILEAMHKRFDVRPEFEASLAVAGKSGTINSRFSNTPAESRLRAKTGTLTGVSALSGFVVTREDRLLAFSVMMNGYQGRARAMWTVQERIGNALAELQGANVIAQPAGIDQWPNRPASPKNPK